MKTRAVILDYELLTLQLSWPIYYPPAFAYSDIRSLNFGMHCFILFFLALLSLCLLFLPFSVSHFSLFFLNFSISFLFARFPSCILRSFCLLLPLSFLFLTFPHSLFISLSIFLISFLSLYYYFLLSLLSLSLSRSTFLFNSLFLTRYFLVRSFHFLPLSHFFLYPFVLCIVSLFISLYSFLEATLVWRELAQNSRCCK
jgi:hypothetical protein